MKRLMTLFVSLLVNVILLAQSGTCGDNTTWTFNKKTGELVVSGSGNMVWFFDDVPWNAYKDSIKIVSIERGVTNIGPLAFEHCSNLTSVSIPTSVTSIERGAFVFCTNLTSVDIPDSVTKIGEYSFFHCIGLTDVIIPNNVKSIEEHAFDYCTKLKAITIPPSVKSIGMRAFSECKELSSVYIEGNSELTIGQECFKDCPIANLTIKNAKTIGVFAFKDCPITSLTINNMESIGGFSRIKIKSLEISNSVKFIEGGAFGGCKELTTLKIGDNIRSIGAGAFKGCTELSKIYIYRKTPCEIESNTFDDVDKYTCTIFVPAGSLEMFRTAYGWSNFYNIKAFKPIKK